MDHFPCRACSVLRRDSHLCSPGVRSCLAAVSRPLVRWGLASYEKATGTVFSQDLSPLQAEGVDHFPCHACSVLRRDSHLCSPGVRSCLAAVSRPLIQWGLASYEKAAGSVLCQDLCPLAAEGWITSLAVHVRYSGETATSAPRGSGPASRQCPVPSFDGA